MFKLSQKVKGTKISLLENYEQVAKTTGKDISEYCELPQLPYEAEYLWDWFLQLSATRSASTAGANPITYFEIEAWSKLSDISISFWELRTIRMLDQKLIELTGDKDEH